MRIILHQQSVLNTKQNITDKSNIGTQPPSPNGCVSLTSALGGLGAPCLAPGVGTSQTCVLKLTASPHRERSRVHFSHPESSPQLSHCAQQPFWKGSVSAAVGGTGALLSSFQATSVLSRRPQKEQAFAFHPVVEPSSLEHGDQPTGFPEPKRRRCLFPQDQVGARQQWGNSSSPPKPPPPTVPS